MYIMGFRSGLGKGRHYELPNVSLYGYMVVTSLVTHCIEGNVAALTEWTRANRRLPSKYNVSYSTRDLTQSAVLINEGNEINKASGYHGKSLTSSCVNEDGTVISGRSANCFTGCNINNMNCMYSYT